MYRILLLVNDQRCDQKMWHYRYRKILSAWKSTNPPPTNAAEASCLVLRALQGHRKTDVQVHSCVPSLYLDGMVVVVSLEKKHELQDPHVSSLMLLPPSVSNLLVVKNKYAASFLTSSLCGGTFQNYACCWSALCWRIIEFYDVLK